MDNMKICIYGGAFDPIHLGHLYIADKVYEELGLDRVVFVPNGVPPWKEGTLFPVKDRVEMASLSISDNPRFDIDTFEADKADKPAYAYDTVAYFKNKYPGARLYFLIGSDILKGLGRWHRIGELAAMVTFICVERDEYVLPDSYLEGLKSKYDMVYLKLPYLNISSTYIRHAINNNQSYRYMVRDSVYTYITRARE